MVERKAFLVKPKHQSHVSQCGKCVYDMQSWKMLRLLQESMLIAFDEWTLILMVSNLAKNRDYYENSC